MHWKIDLARRLDGLFENAVRAPVNSLKHSPVHFFEPDQIIAAIIRRTEHDAIFRLGQEFHRLREGSLRQSWTVGIDQA